jgi:prepilin-type N-terminal cleavage/methylation domain-containing protein
MWATRKINNHTKSGFTIVELLIVIVVIGTLAAITIVAYNGIQTRGRDSRRSNDISQLKTAIALYKTDNGNYPPACGADDTGCNVSNLASYLSAYIPTIPQDPQYSAKIYSYVRGPVANDSYAILVPYEVTGNCKTGNNVNGNWWGVPGSPPTC